MIRHAARAVPWGTVVAACAIVPGLMAITAAWPETMWPLQGVSVGLLAAAAAWSMDERAAAVVDTLPRSLTWRTAARASCAVPLAAVWVACLLVAGARLPDQLGVLLQQGAGALLLGIAVTTWRRARGAATPAFTTAPGILAVVAMLALVRPFPNVLALFPLWDPDEWALSAAIWWALLAAGAVLLAWSLRGSTYRPLAK